MIMHSTLYLIVVKEVWDRIISGEKTIEYRECGEYWDKRIKDRQYDYLRITNGYDVLCTSSYICRCTILSLPRC